MFGLVELARPLEWTKTAGNMVVALAIARSTLNVTVSISNFLLATVAGCLLWSGLYTFNDFTDRKADARHVVKRRRPIPRGAVPPKVALIYGVSLLVFSLALAASINSLLFILLVLMCVNQLAYTMKPFRFKERAVFDLVSGSTINPVLRFLAGWVLAASLDVLPWLGLVSMVLMQFGGFTLYRLSSRSTEKKLAYRSSVALFGMARLKMLAYCAMVTGILLFLLMFANYFWCNACNILGVLHPKYMLPVLGSVVFAPFYIDFIKAPREEMIPRVYRMLYVHYALFVFAFFLLLYVF